MQSIFLTVFKLILCLLTYSLVTSCYHLYMYLLHWRPTLNSFVFAIGCIRWHIWYHTSTHIYGLLYAKLSAIAIKLLLHKQRQLLSFFHFLFFYILYLSLLLLFVVLLNWWNENTAAFSTIGTVNHSVSHLLLLRKEFAVLCVMFSVKEMYKEKNEMKWNVMWCVVSRFALSFQTNVYFGHYSHIFIFFMLQSHNATTTTTTIRLYNCEMVLCFFYIQYSCFRFTDKRNTLTQSMSQSHFIFYFVQDISFSMWLAHCSLIKCRKKQAYCKLK